MADQKSECLIDNSSSNNKSGGGGGGIPTKPLKTIYDLPPEKYDEYFRKRRMREREENKQKSHDNNKEEEESEEYKAYTAHMTECLVKPRLGHHAWWRYRDHLATQKAAAKAAAAAASVYHDDDDDEALGPKKKLKVNEEEAVEGGHDETSTQKENMNSHPMHINVWTRILLMNKGNDLLKPQGAVKASGKDKQIEDTLG